MFSLIRWFASPWRSVMPKTICLLSFVATVVTATVFSPAASANERSSRDGTVVVSWEPSYAQYKTLLVKSSSGSAVAQYPVILGQSWVITGMEDGRYQFSLSSAEDDVTLFTLHVNHYPLTSALGLFVAGLVMFLYLIFTLVKGERND